MLRQRISVLMIETTSELVSTPWPSGKWLLRGWNVVVLFTRGWCYSLLDCLRSEKWMKWILKWVQLKVKGCLNITVGEQWRGAPGLFSFQKCTLLKRWSLWLSTLHPVVIKVDLNVHEVSERLKWKLGIVI